MSNALSPILGIVKPLAKKHINEENISALFNELTKDLPDDDDYKPVLIISRLKDGSVVGSSATLNASRTVADIYHQDNLAELILNLLEKV